MSINIYNTCQPTKFVSDTLFLPCFFHPYEGVWQPNDFCRLEDPFQFLEMGRLLTFFACDFYTFQNENLCKCTPMFSETLSKNIGGHRERIWSLQQTHTQTKNCHGCYNFEIYVQKVKEYLKSGSNRRVPCLLSVAVLLLENSFLDKNFETKMLGSISFSSSLSVCRKARPRSCSRVVLVNVLVAYRSRRS